MELATDAMIGTLMTRKAKSEGENLMLEENVVGHGGSYHCCKRK